MNSNEPLQRPRPLRPGGHIGVLSISGPAEQTRIEKAVEALRARGFKVTLAENVFASGPRAYLSGHDDVRAGAINAFLAMDDVDAFLFTRGGYGAMRVLPRIDFEAVRRNPRPIVGYSDITAFSQAVACQAGVSTFHGPMLNTDFHDGLSPEIEEWFWSALSGSAPLEFRFEPSNVLVPGHAEGLLFGGCLALTESLLGTPYDFWIDDGIWFWEDVGEPLYKLDRMLTHLRLSGRFRALKGIIVGQLRECGDGRPEELDSLLVEFFGELQIPVIRGLPFGHFGNNLLLPIGQKGSIDTEICMLAIPEPVVQTGNA